MATPDDFLDSAVEISKLTDETGNDRFPRAAISRGYYGAYHAAKDVCERLMLPPAAARLVGSHERLFASLIECSSAHSANFMDAKSIGLMGLRILKPFRKAADYDVNDPLPVKALEETIAKARLVIEKSKGIK